MSEPTGLGRRELVAIALYEDCEGIKWANARNDTRAEWRRIAQVALDASGDRSLLRAPTDAGAVALLKKSRGAVKAIAAIARLASPETLEVDAAYWERVDDEIGAFLAVDGLRGTAPDRYPHGEGCPAILSRTGKCDCGLIVSRPDVGTEDRALREQLEALAEAAQNYLMAQQHIGVTEDQMRALHHRLGSLAGPHLKAKCARESVEGEQRT